MDDQERLDSMVVRRSELQVRRANATNPVARRRIGRLISDLDEEISLLDYHLRMDRKL